MVSVELQTVDPPMHSCGTAMGKWPFKRLSRPYSIGSLDDDRASQSDYRLHSIESVRMISVQNTAEAIKLSDSETT